MTLHHIGFKLLGYSGGYKYCSNYEQVEPTIQDSADACKDLCQDLCWGLTYYAGLETDFANRCYLFMSAPECGTLTSYTETLDIPVWSVPTGIFNHSVQQYEAYERAVVWPRRTMEVPVDYVSGEP